MSGSENPVPLTAPAVAIVDGQENSDVEEDDGKEVLSSELISLVQQLRRPTSPLVQALSPQFFVTRHSQACTLCVSTKQECSAANRIRCQYCNTQHRVCSRSEIFNTWAIRNKFGLSWQRAEVLLKLGAGMISGRIQKTETISSDIVNVEFRREPKTQLEQEKKPGRLITSNPGDGPTVSLPEPDEQPVAIRPPTHTPAKRLAPEPKLTPVAKRPKTTTARASISASSTRPKRAPAEKIDIPVELLRRSHRTHAGESISSPAATTSDPFRLNNDYASRLTATEARLAALEARAPLSQQGSPSKGHIVGELENAIQELFAGNLPGGLQRLVELKARFTNESDSASPSITPSSSRISPASHASSSIVPRSPTLFFTKNHAIDFGED
ncbi:hypothetical protein MIND_00879300 [Mycena indigotica]|uniref:Zn(2)-C6 fungal-type domain-containing protein n=1 Tax=Mycena indigotica TaxID=2126181 RepID=A0A8H6SI02_9AGAR|nr:uncharacterized protein MIND_00879300 [Mycena indigotica]KAF7299303.1 hypothetical protein MIND_00879300 [Mycena indigotica]